MKFKFWGVRGSLPTGGPGTVRVGGNTTCLQVCTEEGLIIFDTGTGIRYLGNDLMKSLPVKGKIFYSHVHWDHIQGLPFFTPLYVKGNEFDIYGGSSLPQTIEATLKKQMSAPCFPVPMDIMGATINFYDLRPGAVIEGEDYQIRLAMQNHPNDSYGYRVDSRGKSIVFSTDTEHYEGRLDENLLDLSKNVDYLIYDCQYTTHEYYGTNGQMPRIGWGHSTWEEGVKLAEAAKAKHLILFHHDPNHNDEFIENLEKEARQKFPQCTAAFEGMEVDVLSPGPPVSVFD